MNTKTFLMTAAAIALFSLPAAAGSSPATGTTSGGSVGVTTGAGTDIGTGTTGTTPGSSTTGLGADATTDTEVNPGSSLSNTLGSTGRTGLSGSGVTGAPDSGFAFNNFDTDGDGDLSESEFTSYSSLRNDARVFTQFDTDGDGTISETEYNTSVLLRTPEQR